MREGRFGEEQIIGIVAERQAGLRGAELCRRHGISDVTFDTRRSRHGGLEVSAARRLKQMLDAATLRAMLGKDV